MKQSIRVLASFCLLLILFVGATMPTFAQFPDGKYDQDDVERAQCFNISINVGDLTGVGQYFFLFIYQDFDFPGIEVLITEPNITLEFNVVVPPGTMVQVASPSGGTIAFVLRNGDPFWAYGGNALVTVGDMNTDCLRQALDGRINRGDTHMLAAIYPDGNGGYDIWAIDGNLEGMFDYNVSREAVDAGIAAASVEWQVIGSGLTSTLFAGSNGQCFLQSPTDQGVMQTFEFDCSGS